MATRDMIRKAIGKPSFSQEVIECVIKAAYIANEEMKEQITAASIAKRVNMSRSYFSQCFKEIIGINFSEHLRQIRIDKAKEYLLYTNKTILWIAEHVGYMDEKYFSRTFREQTGMLPSEYRLKNAAGREISDKLGGSNAERLISKRAILRILGHLSLSNRVTVFYPNNMIFHDTFRM